MVIYFRNMKNEYFQFKNLNILLYNFAQMISGCSSVVYLSRNRDYIKMMVLRFFIMKISNIGDLFSHLEK